MVSRFAKGVIGAYCTYLWARMFQFGLEYRSHDMAIPAVGGALMGFGASLIGSSVLDVPILGRGEKLYSQMNLEEK